MSASLGRALGAVACISCAACTPAAPEVPIQMPFALGTGGEYIEFDFSVTQNYGHVVNLEIFFRDSKSPSERKALLDQLGDGIRADGSVGNTGVAISLRVQVQSRQIQGPMLDFDKTTHGFGFVAASQDFATKRVLQITDQPLPPGIYHMRIDNLRPVPEFSKHKVRISIHHAEQGK